MEMRRNCVTVIACGQKCVSVLRFLCLQARQRSFGLSYRTYRFQLELRKYSVFKTINYYFRTGSFVGGEGRFDRIGHK